MKFLILIFATAFSLSSHASDMEVQYLWDEANQKFSCASMDSNDSKTVWLNEEVCLEAHGTVFRWRHYRDGKHACAELNSRGRVIQWVNNNYCRESQGSKFRWEQFGNYYRCHEATPNGGFINYVDARNCKGIPKDNDTVKPKPKPKPKPQFAWKFEEVRGPKPCIEMMNDDNDPPTDYPVCKSTYYATINNAQKQKMALTCSEDAPEVRLILDLKEDKSKDFEFLMDAVSKNESVIGRISIDKKLVKSLRTWEFNAEGRSMTSMDEIQLELIERIQAGINMSMGLSIKSTSFNKNIRFSLKDSRKTLDKLIDACI